VVIITGLSGSGKSFALRALEDIGFYCVDNMPVALLPKFLKIQTEAKDTKDVALVMDLREKGFLDKYNRIFSRLKQDGYNIEIIFLEATDEVLVKRYSETRRAHPLARKGSIKESIALEREKLMPVKRMAGAVLDTSTLNVHELKEMIQHRYLSPDERRGLMFLQIASFGFRYGLPEDADCVFDVRFLPNPYFVESLKNLDGHDARVGAYVLAAPEGLEFKKKLEELFAFLLPLYQREGKTRLNIAFGCTGGKHRSVIFANLFGEFLERRDYRVAVTHRDILKG